VPYCIYKGMIVRGKSSFAALFDMMCVIDPLMSLCGTGPTNAGRTKFVVPEWPDGNKKVGWLLVYFVFPYVWYMLTTSFFCFSLE